MSSLSPQCALSQQSSSGCLTGRRCIDPTARWPTYEAAFANANVALVPRHPSVLLRDNLCNRQQRNSNSNSNNNSYSSEQRAAGQRCDCDCDFFWRCVSVALAVLCQSRCCCYYAVVVAVVFLPLPLLLLLLLLFYLIAAAAAAETANHMQLYSVFIYFLFLSLLRRIFFSHMSLHINFRCTFVFFSFGLLFFCLHLQ